MVFMRRIWNMVQQHDWSGSVLPLLAVATAVGLSTLLIWASGASVRTAYSSLLEGMVGSWPAVVETGVATTPYLLTGLAVALAFRGGLFNIGAEGQLYMGALGAVLVGYAVPGLPTALHLPLALMAGASCGALWGAVPGFLKARLGAHEVINTMMLNYVAIKLVDYLVKNVIRDPAASLDRTPYILVTAQLPRLLGADYRLHAGFILALVAVGGTAWFLAKTTYGFEIQTVGANVNAARYAGMHVARTITLTMAGAGMLAGLAGVGEVLGLYHTLPATFSSGYGFDAIAVALLAKTRPLGLIPAACLWGGLRNGAGLMQVRTGISIDLITVMQALVIICLAADQVMRWCYRLRPRSAVDVGFTRGWRS
jgi:general nucleoside transport system permease protein